MELQGPFGDSAVKLSSPEVPRSQIPLCPVASLLGCHLRCRNLQLSMAVSINCALIVRALLLGVYIRAPWGLETTYPETPSKLVKNSSFGLRLGPLRMACGGQVRLRAGDLQGLAKPPPALK